VKPDCPWQVCRRSVLIVALAQDNRDIIWCVSRAFPAGMNSPENFESISFSSMIPIGRAGMCASALVRAQAAVTERHLPTPRHTPGTVAHAFDAALVEHDSRPPCHPAIGARERATPSSDASCSD